MRGGASPRWRGFALLVMTAVLAVLTVISCCSGAYKIDPLSIVSILRNQGDGYGVLMYVRLPRVVLGLVVGSCLGISGAALQGLFRNPLADPGLIGVTAGAGLGAATWIALGFSVGVTWAPWAITICAFTGGLMVTFAAWKFAAMRQMSNTTHLLLAGVALNSLAGAGIGALVFLSNDEQLRSITFWLLGGLGGSTWPIVGATSGIALLGILVLLPMGQKLNVLSLGEADAYHLGLNTHGVNLRIIIGSTLAVGAAVSAAGGIGFIGLVIPHLLRLFVGPDHRFLLPASALLGAVLLLASDLFARTMAAPLEVPVGVITAFFGAPFFLWLIWRQRGGMAYA